MSETCISVKHATKSYGGRKVVDDLSLEVKKGEVFGLLGHNGAGNIRESYIDGIWNKDDESEWLSEIQIPVKKKCS